MALNQGNAEVVYRCGIAYTYAGDPFEGLRWFERAMRLNPYYPDAWLEPMFEAYYVTKQYEKALELARKYRTPPPHFFIQIAAANAQLGRDRDAQEAVDHFSSLSASDFDTKRFLVAISKMFGNSEHGELWLEGYRKAGLMN